MRYRGMGRIYVEDERDAAYPLSAVLKGTTIRSRDWWDEGWWGDQGYDPHCVAFAWAHWLGDGPKLVSLFQSRRPGVDTGVLYCEAQKRDPWPGDCSTPLYDGTSVRAGAKVMQEWGHLEEYRWASSAEEIAQAVLTIGPVIMGTSWYEGMGNPDRDGVMTLSGAFWGGHAYIVNGVDLDSGMFTIKNSWGRAWGKEGKAFIRMEDLDQLTRKLFGEACIPISVNR